MRRNRETGQALYITIASLVVLMGFLGLGIDLGALRYEERLQQTAADAAAIAGASNLCSVGNCSPYGGVTEGAWNASGANGFADNGGGNVSDCGSSAAVGTVCVQVNNPPQSGPHNGNSNYVEVLVAAVHPTYFMRVLGVSKETVTARAVATNVGGGADADCFYLLGPASAANSGLTITGGGRGSIQASPCGVMDNGDFTSGNSARWRATAGTFAVAGKNAGGRNSVQCSSGQSPCPAYGVPAAGNPLASLAPTVGAPRTWQNTDGPGTYNGMSFGNGNATVNLPPGIYVIDGGSFSCRGNQTITGTGVMFYLTNGAVWDCSGTPNVDLTAPTASNCPACPSQYDGVLIYQDPNDQNTDTMGGTNTYSLNGLVVIWGLSMNGTDTLSLQGTAGLPPGEGPAAVATLVE
jgi:Putative Flp pilus-assembly TadE/G-like